MNGPAGVPVSRPVVVVGLGFGDEAKGATVDHLAAATDDTVAVVRWSGGAQAAHNVRHGDRHHTFAQLGSASFLDVRTLLRAPVLVNPVLLAVEARELEAQGVRDPLGLVVGDARCLVTTPVHVAMNRARELARGAGRHGSTGLGIGETVAYALAHAQGARAGDVVGDSRAPSAAVAPPLTLGMLRDRAATVRTLDALARYAEPLLAAVDDPDAAHASVEEMAAALCTVAGAIEVTDHADSTLDAMLTAGTVIFEGSQGVLLDEWYGFHPHTTWSTITPRTLVAELGAAGHHPYVLGLTRAYTTRHGAGPMPTEDPALVLPEPDNREGRYQGAWRTGHLDLPALRYASRVVGHLDGVGVSHLDHLAVAAAAGTPVRAVERWDGEAEPLRFDPSRDLARAAARTARAARARVVPGRALLVPDDVTSLVEAATGAPVVLTAHGPRRTDRRLVTPARGLGCGVGMSRVGA